MIYLCIVIEVIQNKIPDRTIVMMPGTHPRTLRDHDCAIIAKHTWSPASRTAVFCQDMVRNFMSC